MDDSSGWDAVLVEGWGPLVRAAVCTRVEDAMSCARGVLAAATTRPDDAPTTAVERVHEAVVTAIAVETGAHLDDLGSQSAWATYDDVWAELGRRCSEAPGMELVPSDAEREVLTLLSGMPLAAVEHAGALVDERGRVLLHRAGGGAFLHVEGIFRWLATDLESDAATRDRARRVVERARHR